MECRRGVLFRFDLICCVMMCCVGLHRFVMRVVLLCGTVLCCVVLFVVAVWCCGGLCCAVYGFRVVVV